MSLRLVLRAAGIEDAELLYDWRRDPGTEANSLQTAPSSLPEHEVWLTRTLANPNVRLYIAELGGQPVGTGRLSVDPGTRSAELSLTVAPKRRGEGIGRAIIEALTVEAKRLPVTVLIARIRSHNVPSLKAFLSNGFAPTSAIVVVERRV